MTTRAILTFDSVNNGKEVRFFRTYAEAKEAIKIIRNLRKGQCSNFQIKIVKPY